MNRPDFCPASTNKGESRGRSRHNNMHDSEIAIVNANMSWRVLRNIPNRLGRSFSSLQVEAAILLDLRYFGNLELYRTARPLQEKIRKMSFRLCTHCSGSSGPQIRCHSIAKSFRSPADTALEFRRGSTRTDDRGRPEHGSRRSYEGQGGRTRPGIRSWLHGPQGAEEGKPSVEALWPTNFKLRATP